MKSTKSRKSLLLAAMSLLLIAALLAAGCGNSGSTSSTTTTSTQSQSGLKGDLTISGSTSMEEVNNALAEEFMAANPEVKINIQALGSSQGIQAAAEGTAQIGAASREINADEKSKTPDLKQITIAKDGIAVVVNPANKVSDLKKEDIKKIYLGEISNWKELGGDDQAITVVRREDGSGTLDAFSELVLDGKTKDLKYTSSAVVQNSTGAVMSAVGSDPNAIGFASMASLDSKVKAIKIDGVEATVANVLNGSYKAQRSFNYVTRGDASGVAKAFLDYALSAEGQKVVEEAKAIPVK